MNKKIPEAVCVDMTPEIKEKFSRIAHHYIDDCKLEELKPIEAYACLHFITSTLERLMGVKVEGMIVLNEGDKEH